MCVYAYHRYYGIIFVPSCHRSRQTRTAGRPLITVSINDYGHYNNNNIIQCRWSSSSRRPPPPLPHAFGRLARSIVPASRHTAAPSSSREIASPATSEIPVRRLPRSTVFSPSRTPARRQTRRRSRSSDVRRRSRLAAER